MALACTVLFQGLEFLKKPSVVVEGAPPPTAHIPTGFLPPSPCSQSPEVTGTQWSLSRRRAEGTGDLQLEKAWKSRRQR